MFGQSCCGVTRNGSDDEMVFVYVPIQSLDEIISFSERPRSVYKYGLVNLRFDANGCWRFMSHFNLLQSIMEPVDSD